MLSKYASSSCLKYDYILMSEKILRFSEEKGLIFNTKSTCFQRSVPARLHV